MGYVNGGELNGCDLNDMSRARRRGMVMLALIVGIGLLMVIGMFGVDIGVWVQHRQQASNAAVAAARYGVADLTGDAWSTRAAAALAENGFDAADATVEAGLWDFESHTFTPDAPLTNAVRVTLAGRAAAPFASYFGLEGLPVEASAVAMSHPGAGMGIGLVALDGLHVDGASTLDSYNSSSDPNFPATASTAGGSGEFVAASNGAIDVANGGSIWGDVVMKPSASLSFSAAGFASGGVRRVLGEELELPATVIPAGTPFLGSHTVTDGTYTLPGGRYSVGNINMGPNVTVRFTGPAEVYVTGNVTFQGTIGAYNSRPANFKVYQTNGGTLNIDMAPGRAMVAEIYSHDGTVNLSGGGGFFGQVKARQVNVTDGTDVYIDTAVCGSYSEEITLVQ